MLWGWQETRVELSGLHPTIWHDKKGFPALSAGALPASLSRHTEHRASHPAAVTQQASFAPLDGGLGGVAMPTVGGLVGHDPADGKAGECRPDGERRDCRRHEQVKGDQALWFNQQTLLQNS